MGATLILLIGGGAAGAFVTFVVILLVVNRSRQSTAHSRVDEDLSIDVTSLSPTEVPAGVRLEFYGVPVRLMVLVIAPTGRGEPLEKHELPTAIESLLPNLMTVLNQHQPIFRQWPAQLSSTGFQHVFFSNVHLPGDHGKGTPWCGVVGRFFVDGRPYLAGMACVADSPNGLSEVTVEHEGRWLDVLRVRDGDRLG